jgi:predicted hotdog family 3-hydroxylacyl-ACP dehydratase
VTWTPPVPLPLDAAHICDLLPHAGAMCLLGEALACDAERIACRATSHLDPGNPLRRGGVLRAICGIEYAAQAMALHGALLRGSGPARAGYLISVRDVHCGAATLDACPGPLEITAERTAVNGNHVAYAFRIVASGTLLLQGRATVVLGAA